jgi:holo-[acyl-carrier-protein] synthase
MMLSTGTDIVEVRRIDRHVQRFGVRFLKNVYSSVEIGRYSTDTRQLAGAFAAKEAGGKALGVGFAYLSVFGVLPVDIEITLCEPQTVGICQVMLHGTAQQRALDLHLTQWALSVIRLDSYAIALVTATSADVSPDLAKAATIGASHSIARHHLSGKYHVRSRHS